METSKANNYNLPLRDIINNHGIDIINDPDTDEIEFDDNDRSELFDSYFNSFQNLCLTLHVKNITKKNGSSSLYLYNKV